MNARLGARAAVLLAALAGGAAAIALDRLSPPPAADVTRGSEEAFAQGLHLREIPPGGRPQRWTQPRAVFVFRDVPAGPGSVDVAVHGHRAPVAVALDGVILGQVGVGQQRAAYEVQLRERGRHTVELRVEPFVAGDGRVLGALLQRVRLAHARPRAPSPRLLAVFVLPAVVVAVAALFARMGAPLAAAAGLLAALGQGLLLWPQGLARSGYAASLGGLLAAGALVAAAFARACERRWPGAAPWAFAAALASIVVQGLVAASPVMVVSDAVFHANNLSRVAGGDFFITSLTQHARPFRFPYGVSFYALLAPFAGAGADRVALVRVAAAAAAVAASGALFAALAARSSAARAGLAVLVLQVLPVTLDVHSHGNLSNVFGQAATTGFFAWWTAGAPGAWPLGAALFAAGALGHLSSLIVLAALALALAVLSGRAAGRSRLLALAVGAAAAGAYYLHFVPLVAEQLPRLLEGGGQGRGASRGTWGALRLQLLAPLVQWGGPALVLAWLGRPRSAEAASSGGTPELARDVRAYWLAGAALALVGMVSPLEVRYLYALTVPLAAAAALGVLRLWDRGRWGRWGAAALLAAQAGLAAANALDALLRRYR